MAGHKWWRISNITTRGGEYFTVATLSFNNLEQVPCNKPEYGFSSSTYTSSTAGDRDAKNAFDGNLSTIAAGNISQDPQWYIGYKFETAVNVTSISLQMRQDMQAGWGQEWQSAYVDFSDNGVDWVVYGFINPLISENDISLKTTNISVLTTAVIKASYWRLNNIVNLGSSNNNVQQLRFINSEGIISNNPSNAISSTTDSNNPASNAFDSNTSTYAHWNGSYCWVGYIFDTPVTVTGLEITQIAHGSEAWQSVVIEYSYDGIAWKPLARVETKIPNNDTQTRTFNNLIPLTKPLKTIKEGVYWWNILPDVTSLFAFDFNSAVDLRTGAIASTNNSDNFLYNEQNTVAFKKEIISAPKEENFIPFFDNKIYTYKTLKLLKSNFIFSNPFSIPESFTFILKVKINSRSVFLNTNLSDNSGNLLTYESPDYVNSAENRSNWRISGFYTGSDYKEENRRFTKDCLKTVIMKGSILEKKLEIITDYGTYNVPITASIFNILSDKQYSVLGYTYANRDWGVDANIVAYGLFNKNLSMDQVNNVLSQIDKEFLVNVKDIIYNSLKPINVKKTNITHTTKNNFTVFANTPYYSKTFNFASAALNPTVEIKDYSIQNYKILEDYVYEEGVPVKTKLYLYERYSGELISKTWSDKNGYFIFKNLDSSLEYVVTSNDKKHQFKSIIKNY